MWPDTETDQDFLNFSEVAGIAADTIRNPGMLPLSLGVFGGWGAGKSSLLQLIEADLAADQENYIFVRFDAWLYQDFDDARAALMETIAKCLEVAAKENKTLLQMVGRFAKRINYFRVAGLAAEAGAAMLGLPMFGAINKGVVAVEKVLAGTAGEEDAQQLTAAIGQARSMLSGIVKEESRQTPPKEITEFREEFQIILGDLGKTMVVFIDNLDRCLPKSAIQTLEAIRLFLFVPHTAFVIAADEEMIRLSVKEHYGGLKSRHVTDYLDKFIQVPVRVPRLGIHEMRSFLYLLFALAAGIDENTFASFRKQLEASLRESWQRVPMQKDEAISLLAGDKNVNILTARFDLADRITPQLVQSFKVQGNPRIVKRLLNTVFMRIALAQKRKIPLDEAIIAKLALFERCMNSESTAELYRLINDAADGKPTLLAELDKIIDEPKLFEDQCPEVWAKDDKDFVKDWIVLEPMLGNVDLRPAVYLSRETSPLQYAHLGLSQAGQEALIALLSVKNRLSRVAQGIASNLQASEIVLIMENLVADFRKESDWSVRPKGFTGAVSLAEASTEAGKVLRDFIQELFGKGVNEAWLRKMVANAEWFEQGG